MGDAGAGGIDGLSVTTRRSSSGVSGPETECLQLVATGDPVTVDRVVYEGRGAPRTWTDVVVDAEGTELCIDVCACATGRVGAFTVTEGDQSVEIVVSWWSMSCCETGP